MTEREKIAAKIRALLAKTVENGCTEDEAIAAAAKVAELLARYNLTLDEVSLRASPFQRHTEQHEDDVGDRLWKIADGIAQLIGVKYWTSASGVFPVEVSFFGFAHEVEIARYLLEICGGAMRRECSKLQREFALLTPVRRRRKILPYLDGMADRLRKRIIALKQAAPTGRGLIVLHDALVEAAMTEKLHQKRGRDSRSDEETYQLGVAAADRVSLNRGLAGAGHQAGLLR